MKRIVLLTLTLLILSACSSGLGASPSVLGDWKLVSYGDPANPSPALPNVESSIKFDSNGQISGNVGCNTFGGTYEVSGGRITFSSLMATLMYCEQTSAQEQAVISVLSDNANLQIQMNGHTLTIISTDGYSAVVLEKKDS